jgi:ribosomal RNA-processing protein 9
MSGVVGSFNSRGRLIMPDSFFASKNNKRKRTHSSADTKPGSAKKVLRRDKASRLSRDAKANGVQSKSKSNQRKRAADEELDSDRTDEDEGGIDDLDLRADIEPESSGDEDVDETPAEKRLRLAKHYLESVKEGLGQSSLRSGKAHQLISPHVAEGEFDAAEVDKELISARLRQDVLEHSGKVHLFIADSVSPTYVLRRHAAC